MGKRYTASRLRAMLVTTLFTASAGAIQPVAIEATPAIEAVAATQLQPRNPGKPVAPTMRPSRKSGTGPSVPPPLIEQNIPSDYPYDVLGTGDEGAIDSRDEVLGRINRAGAIEPIGENAVGESVSLTSGSLSFRHTDITLKGVGPDITITRSFDVDGSRSSSYMKQGAFVDWNLELPYIGTNDNIPQRVMTPESLDNHWLVQGSDPWARCTAFGAPPALEGTGYPAPLEDRWWWNGVQLNVPGRTSDTLLKRAPQYTDAPTRTIPGTIADWPLVTNSHWAISCLGATSNGIAGEAFVAIAPNGDKYWFDWMTGPAYSDAFNIIPGPTVGGTAPIGAYVWMHQIRMMVTRVEDRFGNYVTYNYSGRDLQSIVGSDGRRIEIDWLTTRFGVSRISAIHVQPRTPDERIYRYNYTGNVDVLAGRLDTVVLPDQSSWKFELANFVNTCQWRDPADPDSPGLPAICPPPTEPQDFATIVGSLTAPSGIKGTFTLKQGYIGREVGYPCGGPPDMYAQDPCTLFATQVQKKVYSGAGIDELWKYEFNYGAAVITDPLGAKTGYQVVNSSISPRDGQVVKTWRGATIPAGLALPWTALETTATTLAASNAGPFPTKIGTAPQFYANRAQEEHLNPERNVRIERDGESFVRNIDAYDRFGRPAKITRSSSLGHSRTENLTYDHHLLTWTLGRTDTVSEQSTGRVAVDNAYDAATGNLTSSTRYGVPGPSYTYYVDGTIETVTDADNRTTRLSDYKRGTPQRLDYALGEYDTFVVNDLGEIKRSTDGNGYATEYGYDPVGRLAQIVYPNNDTVAWNATSTTYTKASSAMYGLPAGHWQQTTTQGDSRTITYYDARWRPVVKRVYDTTNLAGTQRIVVRRYDAQNRKVFESYPRQSIGTTADNLKGTTYFYDALGRMTRSLADSELGAPVDTRFDYLTGFRKQITTARQRVVTTTFQAFDEPTEGSPTRLSSSDAQATWVEIVRDVFGKPLSITRGGTHLGKTPSYTRQYVYDAGQRLCKSIDPESNATIVDYYDSGRMRWSAPGQNLTGTTACNRENVAPTEKTVQTYDARGRRERMTPGDGSADVFTTYYADGAPRTVESGGSIWTYAYNMRRLLERETLAVDGRTFEIAHRYDANGNASSTVYPDGEEVAYQPDALGAPRSAGTYATNATVNVFGGLATFTYGNGIAHTVTPNVRGLPEMSQDAGVFNEQYIYDENTNVKNIVDLVDGNTSREMVYDELDRLVTANAPGLWGSATFTYDPFDNLKSSLVGLRNQSHVFDATTNRMTSISRKGSGSVAYAYDTRGNVIGRGQDAFTFDRAGRLTAATGKETYAYDGMRRRVSVQTTGEPVKRYTVYGSDGRLMHEVASNGKSTNYIYLGGSLVARSDASDLPPPDAPILTSGYDGYANLTGVYTLSWTEVERATRYELQEMVGTGAWTGITGYTGRQWTATGKTNGAYSYRVRACDAVACGPYSTIKRVTVQLMPDPIPAPILSSPSPNTSGAIVINWTMPGQPVPPSTTGDLVFTIQESANNGAWIDVTTRIEAWTYTRTGRANGNYRYRGQTCIGSLKNRCGPFGSEIAVTVAIPTIPPLPTSITSSETTSDDGAFRVSWPMVTTADRYVLQQRRNNGSWSEVHNGSALAWYATGLTNGTYDYRVTACNALGCNPGWRDGAQTVVNIPAQLPPPPTTVTATPLQLPYGSLTVTWSAVTGADAYKLQELRPGGNWTEVYSGSQRTWSGVGRPSGIYKYKVQSCVTNRCGEFSTEASATLVGPPPPVATMQIAPSPSSDGNYTVSWTAVAGATVYLLEERLGANGEWSYPVYDQLSATQARFTGRGDGTYYYRIRSCRTIDGRVACSELADNATAQVNVAHPITVPVPDTINSSANRCIRPNTSFSIWWSEVATADRYELEEINAVTDAHTIKHTNGLSLSFSYPLTSHGGISHDPTDYSYNIRACRGAIGAADAVCSGWRGPVNVCLSREPTGSRGVVRTATYLHTDGLGSLVAESNTSGAVTKRYHYEPFGAPTDGSYANGVGYAGHVTDRATQLSYMEQRYYDPLAGRFLSIDPVEVHANGDNFNRYAYASNNPFSRVDRDGRDSGMYYVLPQFGVPLPSVEEAKFAMPIADLMYGSIIGFAQCVGNGCSIGGWAGVAMDVIPVGKIASGLKKLANATRTAKATEKASDEVKTLYHYTDEKGMDGILKSKELRASLEKPPGTPGDDAMFGSGQYLSDIVPGTKTCSYLAHCFVRNGTKGERFTNYVEIDVRGLRVEKGRENVFVIPNTTPLDLTGRILGSGKN